MSTRWQDLVADKKLRQAASIPKEWLITYPAHTVLDVRKVPDECGLLTPKEIEITNTVDVQTILANLATGKWTSVEVTLAFYKRAIIAQQLVCLVDASPFWTSHEHRVCAGELLDRDLCGARACPSEGTG